MALFNSDITSANAVAFLTVNTLFPAGIRLENWSADQAITADERQIAETRMGVDGKMTAGYVPSIHVLTLTFEPVSPSLKVIEQVVKATESSRRIYRCGIIITLPSLGKSYSYQNGVMMNDKLFPDIKKILDPVTVKWNFEKRSITSLF